MAKVTDFQPDPQNVNKGTERGQYMVETSLTRYGAGRSIVVDKNGIVLAGNKTQQAAVDLGIEEAVVVETTGDKLVVVKRNDLDLLNDPKRAREYSIADNRAGEVGLAWDEEALAALAMDSDFDLDVFWSKDELAALLPKVPAIEDSEPQIDRAEELREKWQTERGQVWEIPSLSVPGKAHRVMCGDSTNADDVGLLMGGNFPQMIFCDPLYESPPSVIDVWVNLLPEQCHFFILGSDKQLVEMAYNHLSLFRRFFAINMKAVKINSVYAPATMIDMCIELLKGKTHFQNLHDAFSNYLESSKHLERLGDKTKSKQVPLVTEFIIHYSTHGEIIADGFLGSGTTLIAAEQTGRICYGMEIEPKYVAVILQRAADVGLAPTLPNES